MNRRVMIKDIIGATLTLSNPLVLVLPRVPNTLDANVEGS